MKNENCSMDEIMQKLQAPFASKDIEWRVSHSGMSKGRKWAMVLAYVTNRAIQNRLDDVFGPGGWKNEYHDFQGGILCTISCYINGQWVSKTDGAERTDIESFKGGLSNAMKRCGSQWGIGRYLYNLDSMYVEVFDQKKPGAQYINDKKNQIQGYWLPPQLPNWALPPEERNQNANRNEVKKKDSRPTTPNTKPTNNNSKPSQNQVNNGEGFDRRKAVSSIAEMIRKIGIPANYVMAFFKRINPAIQQKTVEEVFQKASEQDLKKYYAVMRPVNDLQVVANHYKVAIDDVLRYVQILLPEQKIDSLLACLTHLKKEHVKEVIEFIKEDLKTGSIQQIA